MPRILSVTSGFPSILYPSLELARRWYRVLGVDRQLVAADGACSALQPADGSSNRGT